MLINAIATDAMMNPTDAATPMTKAVKESYKACKAFKVYQLSLQVDALTGQANANYMVRARATRRKHATGSFVQTACDPGNAKPNVTFGML